MGSLGRGLLRYTCSMGRIRTFYRAPEFATLEEAMRWAQGYGGVFVEDCDGRSITGKVRGSCESREAGLRSQPCERRSLRTSVDATVGIWAVLLVVVVGSVVTIAVRDSGEGRAACFVGSVDGGGR